MDNVVSVWKGRIWISLIFSFFILRDIGHMNINSDNNNAKR